MLAEALWVGHAGLVMGFAFEGHADTLSPGWFHGSLSTLRFRQTHSMGQEPESSHCFQSLFTNPEIRWSQRHLNAILPMTSVASAGAYLLSAPVELEPNAQAEARATLTDIRAAKKRALWPVAFRV